MKKVKNKSLHKGNTSPNININTNNNTNNNKKYDIIKLQSLLEDLEKKDLEYDLIIKGLKEKINRTKRENTIIEKEIDQLKSENNDMNKKNKKIYLDNYFKKKEINNKKEFNKNMENLHKNNIEEKFKEELQKNKEIKNKIANIQQEINNYQNRLYELESILNYTNPDIQKEGEDMKKFLSEL